MIKRYVSHARKSVGTVLAFHTRYGFMGLLVTFLVGQIVLAIGILNFDEVFILLGVQFRHLMDWI